ncbi:MAG: hypothetical protein K6G76_08420 [Lachnospiraceae bacterium]|nr:hypothetical protein [Lachnospiraceae bacterium]
MIEELKKKFTMTNAADDWTEFRGNLTSLVSHYGTLNGSKKLAIVGAGRCNDLCLVRLLDTYENIVMIDNDSEAMKEAVKDMPVNYLNRIECKEFSITGLYVEDIDRFCLDLFSFVKNAGYSLNMEMYQKHIISGLDRLDEQLIKTPDRIVHVLGGADVIVCNGVFSQLFSMLLFFISSLSVSIAESLLPDAEDAIALAEKKLSMISDKVIPIINDALFEAAKDFVIYGNEYDEKRPVEGAHQCIQDIRTRYEDVIEEHLDWNFNRKQGVMYDMLISVCNVSKTKDKLKHIKGGLNYV